MGLWNALKHGNLDYFFIDSKVTDANESVAIRQEEIVREDYARGTVSTEQYQAAIADITNTDFGRISKETGSPTDVFLDEVGKGPARVADNVRGFVSGTIANVWRAIPNEVIIIGALGLLVYILLAYAPFIGAILKGRMIKK